MGKLKYGEYNYSQMEKDMPTLKFLSFNCPHCTDEEGNFGTIMLYIPRGDEYEVATQCNCNGQEDRCSELLTVMQTYNSKQLLKKLNDK